ncbi:MAG: hypothetical protein H6814_09155 [Phycisphaeraceae bacterium]|nr:hypothetical protein [Phycisphaeraceae bacterium]
MHRHNDAISSLIAVVTSIGALLIDVAPSIAQAPPPTSRETAPISFTLSGDIKLDQLVELISTRLGVSVEYPQRELAQRTVTLRLRRPLDDRDLWRTLTLVLEGQGYAIVSLRGSDILRIVPATQAPNAAPGFTDRDELESHPDSPGSNFVSVLVGLRSASPAAVSSALQPLLTPQAGQIKAVGETGLMLISDYRGRVQRALELIDRLDAPPDPITRRTIPLQSSTANRVIESVQLVLTAEVVADPTLARAATGAVSPGVQLLPTPDDRGVLILAPESRMARITELIEQFDVAERFVTRAHRGGGAPLEDLAESVRALLRSDSPESFTPRIITDRLTSTIYVTATEAQQQLVDDLIAEILEGPAGVGTSLLALEIRNRDATELAETLRELLEINQRADPVVEPANAQASPPASPAPGAETAAPGDASGLLEGVGEQVTISVDTSTNSILVVADPLTLAQVESIVERLDRRQPQVMIELTLVSLDEGDALDFGVELTGQFVSGQTTFDLASLFGLGAGTAISGGTGFTGSIINPGDFNAVVRALEAVNAGRSVSSPKTLVNNNATATVRGVSRAPFTSLNASDTVATTSLGGFEDAGTTVSVTPHITAGDHLSLEYSVELSAFTGESTSTGDGGVLPPPSQQNSFDGEVTIPDGYAVVLGGLETRRTGESTTRVPVLGEIPILGLLFSTTSESETISRFYIIIKATVLRAPGFEDLRLLGERDLAEAGVDDGFPVLSPIWLD